MNDTFECEWISQFRNRKGEGEREREGRTRGERMRKENVGERNIGERMRMRAA